MSSGSLICVGVGMTLGAHLTPICRSHIEKAEQVFLLASHGLVEQWIASLNPQYESLQEHYSEHISRRDSYDSMTNAIFKDVAQGKRVVAAFYGHPGVFACVAHKAIAKVKAIGLPAHMEAGISAEDCLYADLNIDPGKTGCIHYETSQFMFYQRSIDTAAHLVLWQVSQSGDKSYKMQSQNSDYLQLLVSLLEEHYPLNHEVILYEAKVLPTDYLRIDRIALSDLPSASLTMATTLVIPPCSELKENTVVLEQLRKINNRKFKLKLVQ